MKREGISVATAKEMLNFYIDNNKRLQDEGQTPVAVCFTGPQGIGKTDIVEQVATERGMTFVKLSLHELEEVGDLVGYPMKIFKIVHREKKDANGKRISKWIPETLLDQVDKKAWANSTEPPKMAYAQPSWVPTAENPNGTILLLDDYARSSSMMVQATMELINKGRYVSWKLPNYTTIVLTANPDNGEFNVCSLDPAQRNRFVDFNLNFDIEAWAKWAEAANIDGRAINFALTYSTELFMPNNGVNIATPRGYVTFCKSIGGIKDWKKELDKIILISAGCFNDRDSAVGKIFAAFVNNGYDKLVSPKEIFEYKWDTVYEKLKKAIYGESNDFSNFNAAVASMLSIRIVNWLDNYFNKPGYESGPVVVRLIEIFESRLFPEDQMFHVIKSSVSNHPQQLAKLMQNPKIAQQIIL